MRNRLMIALGFTAIAVLSLQTAPAFAARKIQCSRSCYCPFNKTACQQLCERRYQVCKTM